MNTGRVATTGLLLLALALPLAAADSFSVRVKPVSADIFPFEVATYNLTIFNNNPQNASFFQLSGRGGRWLILDEPKLETVEILPGDSSDFLISVTPKLGVGIGPFGIPVKVKDLTTGEYEEFNLPINIKEVDMQTYRPSVALGTSVPREIDPRKAFSVDVLVRNRNPLDIGNLGIKIRGGLFLKDHNISLGPLQERSTEFIFTLSDPLEPPGRHALSVEVYYRDEKIVDATKEYETIGYSELVTEDANTTQLFRARRAFTAFNAGNVENTFTKAVPVSRFARLFTKTDPPAQLTVQSGRPTFKWAVPVQAQEAVTVSMITDYRSLAIVAAALLLLVLGYFVFRNPLVAYKDAMIQDSHTGDLQVIKVRLFVKNRTRRTIHNVRVMDKIPVFGTLHDEGGLGTVRPAKVVKGAKRGTLLRWDLPVIEPYEERILAYKVKSTLKVIGGMNLPAASVRFDTAAGVERVATTNSVASRPMRKRAKEF